MNVALRQPMTVAEFLAWEERQALKHREGLPRVLAEPSVESA